MFVKVKVESSAIKNVSYDEQERVLRLEFTSGGEYDYPEVPKYEFINLTNAPSVGKYYNTNIKKYSARKVL